MQRDPDAFRSPTKPAGPLSSFQTFFIGARKIIPPAIEKQHNIISVVNNEQVAPTEAISPVSSRSSSSIVQDISTTKVIQPSDKIFFDKFDSYKENNKKNILDSHYLLILMQKIFAFLDDETINKKDEKVYAYMKAIIFRMSLMRDKIDSASLLQKEDVIQYLKNIVEEQKIFIRLHIYGKKSYRLAQVFVAYLGAFSKSFYYVRDRKIEDSAAGSEIITAKTSADISFKKLLDKVKKCYEDVAFYTNNINTSLSMQGLIELALKSQLTQKNDAKMDGKMREPEKFVKPSISSPLPPPISEEDGDDSEEFLTALLNEDDDNDKILSRTNSEKFLASLLNEDNDDNEILSSAKLSL